MTEHDDLWRICEEAQRERAKAEADRDHADKCFNQAIFLTEAKGKEIERLTAENAKHVEYIRGLEDDYSRQGLTYRAEIERLRTALAKVRGLATYDEEERDDEPDEDEMIDALCAIYAAASEALRT